MNELHLANNLVRLRRERKVTQEELADFIGVTKASVSKWENRQSTPDILLLPQLAAFFGVTVDELLGYEAQLSKEQIRRCYMELSGNFTRLSFGEAMQKARSLVQRYYSCYPLLLQICVLYMNHFMLAEKEEEQRQILKEAEELCDRIREYCTDVGMCGDAITLKAVLNLQLGNAAEVIEMMEPVGDPTRISGQNEAVLIQAYQMAGETEKAKDYIQIRQYLHLLILIENAAGFLLLYGDDLEKCEETIKRTQKILEVYQVDSLHPNQAAQFYYQAAVVYAANAKKEKALEELRHFKKCVSALLNCEKMMLHGDDYFDRLDIWIESLPLGDSAPREKVFARQNALQALSHPAFSSLQDSEEFQKIYHYFQKEA